MGVEEGWAAKEKALSRRAAVARGLTRPGCVRPALSPPQVAAANTNEWTAHLAISTAVPSASSSKRFRARRAAAATRLSATSGGGGGSRQRGAALAAAASLSGGAQVDEGAAFAAAPRATALGLAASAWGGLGVMYILYNPIKRLLPMALLPFGAEAGEAHALGPLGWAAYAAWVAFMAYTEGYKAFQLKFCPMVTANAQVQPHGNR